MCFKMAALLRNTVRFARFSDALRSSFHSSGLISTTKLQARILGSSGFVRNPSMRELSSISAQSEIETTATQSDGIAMNKRRVFVSSLRRGHNYTTEETLEKYFSEFGELEVVELTRAKFSDKPRGTAMLTFKDEKSVEKLLQSEAELVIDNKPIRVRPYVPKEDITLKPTKGVFVSSVSMNTSQDEIKEHFSQFGNVESVILPRKSSTRERRDFCFVVFSSIDEAKKALAVPSQKVAAQVNLSEIRPAKEGAICMGNTKKITIEPVPSSLTVDMLQQYFEKFGRVLHVHMLVYASLNPKYPRSAGVAFLHFNDEEVVNEVVKDAIHTVEGAEMVVYKSNGDVRKQLTPRDCKISIEGLPDTVEADKIEEHFTQKFGIATKGVMFLSEAGPCLVDFWKTSDVEKVMKDPQQNIGGLDVLVRRLQWDRRVEEGFLRHKTPLNIDTDDQV